MPIDRKTWADAYAKQSQSDYRIYETVLADLKAVEECHRLHYLQMECEKIAKAYQFRDTETAIDDLLTSHLGFSGFVARLLVAPYMKTRYQGQDAMLRRVQRFARPLAREIEKLAPAVDRENTPQNAEYPWEDNEKIIVPCEYSYPNLRQLRDPDGRNFLKIIKTAIEEFDQIRIA